MADDRSTESFIYLGQIEKLVHVGFTKACIALENVEGDYISAGTVSSTRIEEGAPPQATLTYCSAHSSFNQQVTDSAL